MQPRAGNPVDIHVGSQIRLHRKLIGMSQSELAQRLGITFQQVQKYEKGKNRVGASRIHKIAVVLGLDVTALFPSEMSGAFHDAGSDQEALALQAFAVSVEGFALNQAFFQIKDMTVRRRIIALVRALSADDDRSADEG
jgi:transcriptional regulator with XRE-family HTH domain